MPLYGHELSEEIDPFQAGVDWAVKLDKGDFLGREALLKRREDRSLPHRVGLEIEGKRIVREGAIVRQGGKEVGRVTSGTFVPTLARAIAMAYVAPAATAVGAALEVDVRGRPTLKSQQALDASTALTAPAKVVALPFYKRNK
jgi:aminomethyltransferase